MAMISRDGAIDKSGAACGRSREKDSGASAHDGDAGAQTIGAKLEEEGSVGADLARLAHVEILFVGAISEKQNALIGIALPRRPEQALRLRARRMKRLRPQGSFAVGRLRRVDEPAARHPPGLE